MHGYEGNKLGFKCSKGSQDSAWLRFYVRVIFSLLQMSLRSSWKGPVPHLCHICLHFDYPCWYGKFSTAQSSSKLSIRGPTAWAWEGVGNICDPIIRSRSRSYRLVSESDAGVVIAHTLPVLALLLTYDSTFPILCYVILVVHFLLNKISYGLYTQDTSNCEMYYKRKAIPAHARMRR